MKVSAVFLCSSMTLWYWPFGTDEDRKTRVGAPGFLTLASPKLPDLARIQGPDQLAAGLRLLFPEKTPEEILYETEELWRFSHELEANDFVVTLRKNRRFVMVAEVTGPYDRTPEGDHRVPVLWKLVELSPDTCPALVAFSAAGRFTELTDPALGQVKNHIPALRRSAHMVFKWISVIILLFELAYFWPR